MTPCDVCVCVQTKTNTAFELSLHAANTHTYKQHMEPGCTYLICLCAVSCVFVLDVSRTDVGALLAVII